FTRAGEADSYVATPVGEGPVNHLVTVTDLDTWFADHLGFDPRRGVAVTDWLATPTQVLAEATGGAVFADPTGALTAARRAPVWRSRETALGRAATVAAELTNALGLAEPVDPALRPFHDRPFRVLGAERFTDALLAAVTDAEVRALPKVGAVDQFVDSTDVLS